MFFIECRVTMASAPQGKATGSPGYWHSMPVEEVLGKFRTDLSTGLTGPEAARRLAETGPNILEKTDPVRWYHIALRQFKDVLIAILLAAAVVSLVMGDLTDALVILVIVVLNALLGFVQEWRAEQALEALQKMLAPRCTVLRDGKEDSIESSGLVPGDVVILEIGDHVPADLRIAKSLNLQADESSLTGESAPVSKAEAAVDGNTPLAERKSVLWMGTAVTNGWARAIVVETGMRTEFGRIAALTQSVREDATPLQRQLGMLGKQLGVVSVFLSAMVAVVGWLLGKPLAEMFMTGISLAVAVVPEGLPAVVTITLALGIRSMVRRKALLRRLQAAETLGSASVICTDKTGTLTQNEMTVKRIWLVSGEIDVTGVGYDPAGHFIQDGKKLDYKTRGDLLLMLETGLRCNHSQIEKGVEGWHHRGSPTEAALVVAAYKAWLSPEPDRAPVAEFSFNSRRKRMAVLEKSREGALLAHVKGAPEVILELCTRIQVGEEVLPFSAELKEKANEVYQNFANGGLRTLALARRQVHKGVPLEADAVEQELTLLGIVGIIDPPRPEVPRAVEVARRAGIQVIVITGDAAPTALAISREIGLEADRSISGTELGELDDLQLRKLLNQPVLFSRTTPEDKLRIVSLLQEEGHVTAMTGDGVNDAPALKKADIGVAMGIRGTDVAKSAADMILMDDNFASIVSAVEEGRHQYDNIQKFVRYLLSSNVGELLAIFINIVLGGPLILLPVQILWMNLITDGVTALALGVEPIEAGIMERPPRPPKQPILTRGAIAMIALLGGYVGLATLWLFQHCLRHAGPEKTALAGTVAFTGIIILEKINIFNYRSFESPLGRLGFFSNPWLVVAVAAMVGLQLCAVYVPFLQKILHTAPLAPADWGIIFIVGLPLFIFPELYKWISMRRSRKANAV